MAKTKREKSHKREKDLSLKFYLPETESSEKHDLFADHIPAGFPSPAEDFLEKRLDLNDYLVKNKEATFLVKVTGESMQDAGIFDGDVLVVDRSVDAVSGKIVLCVLNGEFTVKRLLIENDRVVLMPANEAFDPIDITDGTDFRIWGVVTFALHKL